MTLDDDIKTLIFRMNNVYINGVGRTGSSGFTDAQKVYAADYVLKLLDGIYIDPHTEQERRVSEKSQQQAIIDRALCAFLDLTSQGHGFLYYEDDTISVDKIKAVGRKLVEKVESTHYTNKKAVARVVAVLTNMSPDSLNSTRGTWLTETNGMEKDRMPFDKELVNNEIIPEAIAYARQRLLYL